MTGATGRWQIVGAACITRQPVVCPPLTPIEQQYSEDLIRTQFLKSGDAEDIDLEDAAKQTAVEFADACEEELRTFKASLPEPGTNHEWVLPQTPWVPGETLRQTCERVVRESCGDDLQVKFLGNAPCGFYKYKYPKNVHQEEFIGAKVFFFKGQVRDTSGSVQLGEDIAEHQWLTQDELDDKFKQSYAKSVSQFLVSDQ
ncbi:39S ribosomal protein L46-like [Homarus americanus]|uniref:Large ribosomal subunit protein mL46 n=1 Tax=Homarus americanus TaxID=6706 RepID=A0A8J5KKY9_HOMAM|nr:39S ribosomal protein L46-like [Homarus americanus]